jgi:hypothetical protein
MSRLLFAASRGARIQSAAFDDSTYLSNLQKWPDLFVIHPDDTDLQYGPISTTLRECAENAVQDYSLIFRFDAGKWTLLYSDYYEYSACKDRLQRSLWLLFMAEFLADEGL